MATNGLLSRRVWSEDLSSAMNSQHEAHVLAVDDSFVDRKVIERLLKISSCKVTAVDSGRRALEFLGLDDEERHSSAVDGLKVDLIITDYCMPGMTGYELLKKIKESSTFRETPVVIMSSENVVARIDRCLEEGAEDFIVKPVKLADVKKLKDYMMMREDKFKDGMDIIGTSGGEIEIGATPGMNKRKSRDDSSEFSSLAAAEAPVTLVQTAPLLSSPTPSESPSLSSDSILSRSSSSSDSLFSQTPLSMTSSSADSPSSPVTSPSEVLDYPTRKIKLIVSDEHEIAPDSKL